jgi:hypothetical protein
MSRIGSSLGLNTPFIVHKWNSVQDEGMVNEGSRFEA